MGFCKVYGTPAVLSTPPPPPPPGTDTKSPTVKAQTTTVKHKKKALLRFRVSDDSGSSAVVAGVFRKSAKLVQFGPETLDNGSYHVEWRAPSKKQRLTFCVLAQDAAGNQSKQICAAIRVT